MGRRTVALTAWFQNNLVIPDFYWVVMHGPSGRCVPGRGVDGGMGIAIIGCEAATRSVNHS